MNFAYRLLLPGLMLTFMAVSSHAQEAAGEEGEKRVQYQLVLPEEKTPENVKPEEHNPFESENEALSRQSPGDTEENRVRDKLLKLPVVGTKRMADGRMRVLLGDIILETGRNVPPVLPDQLVELKVKNITPMYIELAWQEKRLTGLPPKLMTIPINISPQVRYQMFGQTEAEAKDSKGVNATMAMPLRDPAANTAAAPQSSPAPVVSAAPAPAAPPRAQVVADDPLPFSPPRLIEPPPSSSPPRAQEMASAPAKPLEPAPPAPPPPSPAVESVVRMLFGNPTPAPK
ncbi:MAG: hypothetical protein ACYC67_22760 [Prosthecobacter sp.]